MKRRSFLWTASVVAALTASAQVELGAPFADGAVLQRGMKVPVWGKVTPAPGKSVRKISVSFAGQTKTTSVDSLTGRWRADLDPMDGSKEDRTLAVRELQPGFFFDDVKDTVEVKGVLVGEVWFASGQSNMELPIWGPLSRYRDKKGAMLAAMTELRNVRYVKVPRKWSVVPSELTVRWRTLTSANLATDQLSAIAFYAARELYLALDVPIGIVDASWGGTNIDAWTPRCGYADCDPSVRETADYAVKANWNGATDRKGPICAAFQQPTVLWNGMVAAFAPMALRGFFWYQGEHNSEVWYQGADRAEPQRYAAKMHALYNGWSRAFGNPNLKLYFAMLAPYNQNWFALCNQQSRFAAEEKNAEIAVTADVGNFDDIHPNDKEIVAQRLVLHALKRDYGFAIPEDRSPVFRTAKPEGNQLILEFDHVQKWYHYALNDWNRAIPFEVAGTNGVWQAAKIVNFRPAKNAQGQTYPTEYIDESRIVLKSDKVAEPVKARFMALPRTASTLYNEASLPLGAFETK